jgi:hypothetical protein
VPECSKNGKRGGSTRSCFPSISLPRTSSSSQPAQVNKSGVIAAANLKLSASVEVIDKFALALTGKTLQVDFAGRRRRQYVNVQPYEIRIHGIVELES